MAATCGKESALPPVLSSVERGFVAAVLVCVLLALKVVYFLAASTTFVAVLIFISPARVCVSMPMCVCVLVSVYNTLSIFNKNTKRPQKYNNKSSHTDL